MTNVTSAVVLAVDSTQVKTASGALEKMAASGAKADTASEALERSAQSAAQAMAALAAVAQRLEAAQNRLGSSGRKISDNLGQTAKSSGLAAYQTAQLSAQLQDLFVQIQAGGSPLTAFIQQGSQLSAVFGGFRPALSALGGLFSVTRVAIGGLVGAAGLLVAGFIKGDEQSAALRRSLTLTGQAAGITEGQFNSLAKSVAESTKTTVGSTRETLQGLVSSGRFSGQALTEATTAAQLLAKTTGQGSDEIVADLSKAADGVAKYAEQANRSYNFLTAAQLSQIKTLEDQGRKQDALALTFSTLNGRLKDSARDVGTLESAWLGVKNAVSSASDALANIGRKSTADDELARVQKRLEELRAIQKGNQLFIPTNLGEFGGIDTVIKKYEDLRDVWLATKKAQEDVAAGGARRADQEQAAIAFDKVREQSLTKQEQLTKALADADALARRAGASDKDRLAVLADIRKRFDDGSVKAGLERDLAGIQTALEGQIGALRNTDSIVEALHSARLVEDGAFYDAKRALLDADTRAQVKALEDENARLARQQATGKDRIDIGRQVAENLGKINRLQADAAAKGTVLTIQQTASADALARAYDEARASAQSYLDTLQRGQQQELAGAGLGSSERQRQAARQQIADRFEQQRQQLDSQKRANQITQDRYDNELALIEEFKGKALASYDDYYGARLKQEEDFNTGASEALANYLESNRNVAKQSEDAFGSAFRSAEDALVQFVTTGKTSVKGLVQSIIADFARIQIRQSLSTVFSALFGAGSGVSTNGTGDQLPTAGGRAIGGPVSAGAAYQVAEKGRPEVLSAGGKSYLLTGSQGGTVTPAQPASGGDNFSINLYGEISQATQRYVQTALANFAAKQMSKAR